MCRYYTSLLAHKWTFKELITRRDKCFMDLDIKPAVDTILLGDIVGKIGIGIIFNWLLVYFQDKDPFHRAQLFTPVQLKKLPV